jgi:asparagine synthase (glutamine-hydrolysing)
MCGVLFVSRETNAIKASEFESVLERQAWRGPDAKNFTEYLNGKYFIGHNRLSIVDLDIRSNQPMSSACGRYVISYNGELYNSEEIKKKYRINCKTKSDTEIILELYAIIGDKIFNVIEGMYALVIIDLINNSWIAARDPLGIKPLYGSNLKDGSYVISSEAVSVANLTKSVRCEIAVQEWRLIRRPLPGMSFFKGVFEVPPGTIIKSNGTQKRFWKLEKQINIFDQDEFEEKLAYSVKSHEISDVQVVSLLSGGLDSAVIAALTKYPKCYTVGLNNNNEFLGAQETASVLGKSLQKISVSDSDLLNSWKYLTKIRGEPLSLPNEGLIYLVCNSMEANEKVILTGEGADELLFGYDAIFRYATKNSWEGAGEFLKKYGYSDAVNPTERLIDYVENMASGKSYIDFLEDFFYAIHLPCLLRRMDFSSMVAGKEARVPFVAIKLIEYMYRMPAAIKINGVESKLPLRKFAKSLNLQGALNRRKVGFSAAMTGESGKYNNYSLFQQTVIEALAW